MARLDRDGAAAIARHLDELRHELAASAINDRRLILARFVAHVAPRQLSEAVPSDRRRWVSALTLDGVAPEVREEHLAVVDAFGAWGERVGFYRRWPGPRFELDAASASALADHIRELRRRGVRPRTITGRQGVIERLGKLLAPTTVLAAEESDLERWADDHLERGLVAASRHNYIGHLREFYRWCRRRGLIEVDPAVELIAPRVPAGVPHPISEADLQLALTCAGQPLRAWLVLAAYCGLRAGEIGRLRREHVLDDRQPPLLLVENGKGGKSRLLPLSPMVLAELAPHLSGRRGPLWLEKRSQPAGAVTGRVGKHLRQLGIPHTTHSLRHRFASQMYQRSRGDLRMVQDLLGHSSVATTQIYAQFDREAATRVVDLLGEDLRAAPVILPEQRRGK